MDYNIIVDCVSKLLLVMAGLVFCVNIIVEVVKKNFARVPTSLLATVLSLVLTVIAYFAWASWIGLNTEWYHVVAAVVFGLFVAYAAMFGFDKFKQALEKLKKLKK